MKTITQLQEAVAYLNGIIKANNDHEDGRVNSIADEEEIINALKDRYGDEVVAPKARDWFDVRLFGFPVQIKSSSYSKGASDNFSSKAAILYALTSLTEEECKARTWSQFEAKLLEAKGDDDNHRDYYIITLNKDNGEVHLSSLKTLSKLTSNGNNLPFQIKWKDNSHSQGRSHRDAYRFIVDAYKASVEKKISAHKLYDIL